MKLKYTSLAIVGLFLLIIVSGMFNFTGSNTTVYGPQLASDVVLSAAEMQEDIDYLIEKISTIHPVTINGLTDDLTTVIAQVQNSISEPMLAGEFYFQAAAIAAAVHDAHTTLYYSVADDNKTIDLPIKWLMRSVCIKEATEYFEPGDEIVSIGGMRAEDLLVEFSKIIPAENEGWVRARSESLIISEAILRHFNLINPNDTVTISYMRQGLPNTINIPLTSPPEARSTSDNSWVDYALYKEHSLGVFQLDQCYNNEFYQSVLNEFFTEVANNNIKNVAFDVRNNTGGNSSVLNEFLTYLDKVEKYQGYSAAIRYSKDSRAQRGGLWRPNGIKEYSSNMIRNKQKDPELLFDGQLYVLTSNKTFSSGNWIAVMIQDNKIGTVIGEPTGNAPSSYGDILSFQLPVSGYRFSVSYKNFKRPAIENDPAATLTPDIIVYTVSEDIRLGRDPQLATLIAEIEKQ